MPLYLQITITEKLVYDQCTAQCRNQFMTNVQLNVETIFMTNVQLNDSMFYLSGNIVIKKNEYSPKYEFLIEPIQNGMLIHIKEINLFV